MFGLGPVPAIRMALERANWKLGDVQRIEINEAFAAVPLAIAQELGLPEDIVNVEGGAIAHGHPIGATGAVLTTRLIHSMRRDGAQARHRHAVHRRWPRHRARHRDDLLKRGLQEDKEASLYTSAHSAAGCLRRYSIVRFRLLISGAQRSVSALMKVPSSAGARMHELDRRQPLTEVRRLEDLGDLGVELVDDRLWRSGWRKQAEPLGGDDIEALLLEGRYVSRIDG